MGHALVGLGKVYEGAVELAAVPRGASCVRRMSEHKGCLRGVAAPLEAKLLWQLQDVAAAVLCRPAVAAERPAVIERNASLLSVSFLCGTGCAWPVAFLCCLS